MLFDEYQEQHEEQHEQQYITKHCCSISWYQNNVVWRVPGMAWMTVHYQTLLFYTLVSKQWCLVSHGTPLSRNNNVFCWRRNGTTLFVHGAERNIVVLHVVERNSVVGARRREKRRCLCRETPLRVAVSRAASSSLSATHRTPVFLCGVNSMRLLREVVDKHQRAPRRLFCLRSVGILRYNARTPLLIMHRGACVPITRALSLRWRRRATGRREVRDEGREVQFQKKSERAVAVQKFKIQNSKSPGRDFRHAGCAKKPPPSALYTQIFNLV